MNMKKIIIAIVAIIVIIFGVFLIKQQKDINSIKERLGMNNKTENLENSENDIKTLTQEEFSKYIKEIPVTTDNWKDYITIECKEKQNFDSFGEVTGTYNQAYTKIKDNNVFGYLVLEANYIDRFNENKKTVFSVTSGNDNEIYILDSKDYTTSNLQCTRIRGGNLYTIDLPDDIWGTEGKIRIETSEKYREFVGFENIIISKNSYIKDLGIMINMENMDSTY